MTTLLKKTFLVAILLSSLFPNAFAAGKFVTIGTGSVTGVYYPAGGAICRLVNKSRKKHGVRCTVESTGGSIYNLNALQNKDIDLAIVQSDFQYRAYKGVKPGFPKKRSNLRALFSLHSEIFTIAVKKDSGITKLNDLLNKRVNIGVPGSGDRGTMEILMAAKGWTRDSFKLTSELKASEQPQALCDNKIDAMIFSAGHPNGVIQEVTASCGARLINISGKAVSRMIKRYSYYAYAEIPKNIYINNKKKIKSFGVKATFVATTDLDEKIAYEIVKAVYDNFASFKTLHPVFQGLKREDLIYDGNTAPLHKGAVRYYKEKGLIK